MKQNESKIDAKRSGLEKSQDEQLEKMLAAEKKVNEARAARLAKKQADLAAKAEAEARKPEAPAEEAAPADVTSEAPEAVETTDSPVTDETSSEQAPEEKPAE